MRRGNKSIAERNSMIAGLIEKIEGRADELNTKPDEPTAFEKENE